MVVADHAAIARLVAERIATLVRQRAREGSRAVLGLATGSTPIGVYRELIRLHQQEGLSFRHVVTFNLDEYWPMPPERIHSYHRFMWENLFRHVDIAPEHVHLLSGTTPREEIEEACAAYEAAIRAAGGIDLQLLGIGKTGHIGFNEPGSGATSRTRLVHLDNVTRRDAAADFFGEEFVPREALTMGVATILEAREMAHIGAARSAPRPISWPRCWRPTASPRRAHRKTSEWCRSERTPWRVHLPSRRKARTAACSRRCSNCTTTAAIWARSRSAC